jgi:hypothetical protein
VPSTIAAMRRGERKARGASQAREQEVAALGAVCTEEAALAAVQARHAALAIARRALDDTIVRAWHNGRVVGLTVLSGEMVVPSQALFTLITTEEWFAVANLRETDLHAIAVGDCATVFSMIDRRQPFRVCHRWTGPEGPVASDGKDLFAAWSCNANDCAGNQMTVFFDSTAGSAQVCWRGSGDGGNVQDLWLTNGKARPLPTNSCGYRPRNPFAALKKFGGPV